MERGRGKTEQKQEEQRKPDIHKQPMEAWNTPHSGNGV